MYVPFPLIVVVGSAVQDQRFMQLSGVAVRAKALPETGCFASREYLSINLAVVLILLD